MYGTALNLLKKKKKKKSNANKERKKNVSKRTKDDTPDFVVSAFLGWTTADGAFVYHRTPVDRRHMVPYGGSNSKDSEEASRRLGSYAVAANIKSSSSKRKTKTGKEKSRKLPKGSQIETRRGR